jgi:hypothetical protein
LLASTTARSLSLEDEFVKHSTDRDLNLIIAASAIAGTRSARFNSRLGAYNIRGIKTFVE